MNTTIEIVNLTPHPLNIKRVDGTTHTIAPSGTVARVAEKREALGALSGLAVTRASYGAVEGLPAPTPGRVYVVSALVLAAVQDRADVFAPGPAIRDGEGKIVGADGLSATAAYVPTPTPTNTPRTPNDSDAEYDPTGETAPAGGSEYFIAPYPAKKMTAVDRANLPVARPGNASSAINAHAAAVALRNDGYYVAEHTVGYGWEISVPIHLVITHRGENVTRELYLRTPDGVQKVYAFEGEEFNVPTTWVVEEPVPQLGGYFDNEGDGRREVAARAYKPPVAPLRSVRG